MYILQPIFHHDIWGGDRLASVYGDEARGLAHLYSVRCRNGDSNIILNGKRKGMPLHGAIGEYPLSIALVDAAENLSVQVHPGGSLSKLESYYFIEPPHCGYIYCGLDLPISGGGIMERVGRLRVSKGDYCAIEPGTVHALTAGSFVYEIERGADATYRLHDYGRTDRNGKPRPLHIKEAMEAADFSKKSAAAEFLPNAVKKEASYETTLLAGLGSFANDKQGFCCVTVISGFSEIDGVPVKPGMSVMLEEGESLCCKGLELCIAAREAT